MQAIQAARAVTRCMGTSARLAVAASQGASRFAARPTLLLRTALMRLYSTDAVSPAVSAAAELRREQRKEQQKKKKADDVKTHEELFSETEAQLKAQIPESSLDFSKDVDIVTRASISDELIRRMHIGIRHKHRKYTLHFDTMASLREELNRIWSGLKSREVEITGTLVAHPGGRRIEAQPPVVLTSDEALRDLRVRFLRAAKGGYHPQIALSLEHKALPPGPWLARLPASPSSKYVMVGFYSFVPIEDPHTMAERLEDIWASMGVTGRVYVAKEGVNAWLAVRKDYLPVFEEGTRSIREVAGISLNVEATFDASELAKMPFHGLDVRFREQILADGFDKPYDWLNQPTVQELPPSAWHEHITRLNSGEQPGILLDCRNTYESDVGRFEGAIPLNTRTFRQTWDILQDMLKDKPKDFPIYSYCTGGIRCVKMGAYLEQEMGFTNVHTLKGGVVAYTRYVAEQAGMVGEFDGKTADPKVSALSLFKGVNYVFDHRLGARITDHVLTTCMSCGSPCDVHHNCAFDHCHTRFLQCAACAAKTRGCCSPGCLDQLDLGPSYALHKLIRPEWTLHTTEPRSALESRLSSAKSNPCKHCSCTSCPGPENCRKASCAAHQRLPLRLGAVDDVRFNSKIDYCAQAYTQARELPESPLMREMHEATRQAFPEGAHMATDHTQAALLKALAVEFKASRILELGTFTGCSTLAFAELPSVERVVTCDRDSRSLDMAKSFFQRSGHGDKIETNHCTADELLQRLKDEKSEPFDLIFIDADKKKYKDYYKFIRDNGLLKFPSGILLADNMLFRGLVLNKGPRPETATAREEEIASHLRDFLAMFLRDHDAIDGVVLTPRDGLLVAKHNSYLHPDEASA